VGREGSTARNLREGEIRERKRSLEQCWFFFFGFAATQTTPKEERGGSFLPSFRFQQLSLGLYHAGGVREGRRWSWLVFYWA
jgi:hypothetical protein